MLRAAKRLYLGGYSLIEVLICVGIITILSSISLVCYNGALDNSDLKGYYVEQIKRDLNDLAKEAREKGVSIRAEFVIGTPQIVVKYSALNPMPDELRDYKNYGILKRKLVFRKYKWDNGLSTPAEFYFYPDGRIDGGTVHFGSAFAECVYRISGNEIVHD